MILLAFFIIIFATLFITLFFLFILSSAVKGAPFVVTTDYYVREMVYLSNVKSKDIMCDLGSGDGRIVIAFAKKGIKSHGFENNPFLVLWSQFKIKKEKLSNKAFVHWGDFWKEDFSKYSIITVFGISYIMNDLEKKLKKELKPGARIISVGFKFPNWKFSKAHEGLYLYEKD